MEERRSAVIAQERAARRDAALAKPLSKPGSSGPARAPHPLTCAPSAAEKAARDAQKKASITAMHHHAAALKKAEERRVQHVVWQKDMCKRGNRIARGEGQALIGVLVDTPSVVTLGDLMPCSLPPKPPLTPCPEVAATSALSTALSPPPPSALPPPPPSLLPCSGSGRSGDDGARASGQHVPEQHGPSAALPSASAELYSKYGNLRVEPRASLLDAYVSLRGSAHCQPEDGKETKGLRETEEVCPSVPQPGYGFSVLELSPAPQRRRRRTPRIHRRRRRGERWGWQCGFAPRVEGERAGVGQDSADLRCALQAYGEGPGRSRSGPISIHS